MNPQTIYLRLPAAIQNIVITCYSFLTFRRKYRKADSSLDILDSATSSAQEKTTESFNELISFAISFVPFYSAVAKKHNITAADVTLSNYKNYFPIISKEDIRQNPSQFYANGRGEKQYSLFTSGTSGSPLEVKYYSADRQRNYDFFRAILNKYEVDIFSESATFAGRILFAKAKNNIYWRRDSFLKTTYFSTYNMSDKNLPYYIQELELRKPKFIDSYPSALLVLARFIQRSNINLAFIPELIVTSSETLTDSMRDEISKAFNHAPILDHYGCTEMSVMAYSVGGDKYEFPTQYSLVEFISIDGDISKVIATSLINRAMPLIRYDIGDVCLNAKVNRGGEQICEKIVGRTDDLILTPEGNRVGRLDPIFKGILGVEKAQIIQEKINLIVIKVVLQREGAQLFDERILVDNLKARVGNSFTISVLVVKEIPLNKAGKFKSVISNL